MLWLLLAAVAVAEVSGCTLALSLCVMAKRADEEREQ